MSRNLFFVLWLICALVLMSSILSFMWETFVRYHDAYPLQTTLVLLLVNYVILWFPLMGRMNRVGGMDENNRF